MTHTAAPLPVCSTAADRRVDSDITAQLFANDPGTHPAQRFLTSTAANQVTIDGEVRGESITAMTLRHPVDCYFDHCVVLYETSEISPSLPVR